MAKTGSLWAYLTGGWFQVKDHPEKQHHQRECVEWWRAVQDGYTGAQGACPLVLNSAVRHDQSTLLKGMLGYLSSIYASHFMERGIGEDEAEAAIRGLRAVVPGMMDLDFRAEDLIKKVRNKVAKFFRGGENRRGEAENGQGPVASGGDTT